MPSPEQPDSLLTARLRRPVHPNVAARVRDGIDTVTHLKNVLDHAPFEGGFAESPALEQDAYACLQRVLDRCEVIADFYDVQGPSPAIVAARISVEREIDGNLVQLHRALDAAAAYVAVGTSDAARDLGERAAQLSVLVNSLHEVERASRALPAPLQPRALKDDGQ